MSRCRGLPCHLPIGCPSAIWSPVIGSLLTRTVPARSALSTASTARASSVMARSARAGSQVVLQEISFRNSSGTFPPP